MSTLRLVVITGLSGAGKSQASRALEDIGFFCVDNLPASLIPTFADLCAQSGRIERVALVVDIRGREFFDSASQALLELEQRGFPYQILFLEASDDVLLRRYKETRRRHPLAPSGRLLDGIAEERRRLEPLRGRAHLILDTSGLSPRQLQERLREVYGADSELGRLGVQVVSFGFKHGLPLDADLVLDIRFLPNPHYVPSLRPLTGLDPEVAEYVLRWPVTQRFLQHLGQLVDFLLPNYVNEGKTQLTIAIGCTGGRHRSVVVAERLAERLRQEGYRASVLHRDCRLPDGGPEGGLQDGPEGGRECGPEGGPGGCGPAEGGPEA